MQRTLSNLSVARVEGPKDLQEEIDDVEVEVDCAEDVPSKSGQTFIPVKKTEWGKQRADGRRTNQIQTSRQTAMERRTPRGRPRVGGVGEVLTRPCSFS